MKAAVGNLGRLWRTVRWLRAGQLTGRVRFRLGRPRPDLRPAPALRPVHGAWQVPARRGASLLGPTRLSLLNEVHDVDQVGWDSLSLALLWRYNLHYFDDLNAEGAPARAAWQRALVTRWIAENAPGRGTAWAPYPTSLRIVNWVKWFVGGAEPEPAWLDSLAAQARWLTRRLEWHLLGNHLFANAKALVCAGLFFAGDEADGWLARGLAILARELPEQILADGAQFELSPMYHALALEDLLDMVNLMAARGRGGRGDRGAAGLEPALRQHAAAMLRWLRCLRHPDGALARFNDNAEGIAPPTAEIERYAAALGVEAPAAPGAGLHLLAESGYLRAERGAAVAWLDVGRIGPDYLPGHAHADTLSFELSVGGRQLIVNRGTSEYGTGPRRLAERGTALHSTVQVGAHDSSEVWSGFRVGRRARPGAVRIDGWWVGCSHDGYAHLPGAPHHHRSWQFEADGVLVEDQLRPVAREAATANFHLAPGLDLSEDGENGWRVHDRGRLIASARILQGRGETCTTQHAQRFGLRVPAATLAVRLDAGRSLVHWRWND